MGAGTLASASAPHTLAGATTATRRSIVDRLLAMETLLTLALLAAAALFRLRRPIGDPDLGWHLAAGRQMLDTLSLPRIDTFSYVTEGRSWVVYSWLAEVLFAAADRAFGPAGLVMLATALVTATVGLLLRTCRAAGARHSVAVAATFLAALVAAPTWTVRPHLFSLLFAAVVSHLVVLDRRDARAAGSIRRFVLLVPLMALWANLHVFFLYGFAIVGLHIVGQRRCWPWRTAPPRVRGRLAAVLALAGIALLANPYGIGLLTHTVGLAGESATFEMVTELQTPSLRHAHGQLLTALFFATTAALIVSPLAREGGEVATVFLFGALAYAMARNMPFFAIVAAPVLARHLDALLPSPAPVRAALPPRRIGLHAAVLALCVAIIGTGTARTLGRRPEEILSRTRYPVDAVAFLERQPPLGRLFNHFNWGGYLIATLQGRYQVSIDGRTGLYGNEVLRQYHATQRLGQDWRGFLDRCDPDVVLWPVDGPFVRALELLPGWRRLYEDDVAVIFVRDRRLSARYKSNATGTQVTPDAGAPST
jgi:hypothetical protein